jgi:hypothetical protein
LGNLETEFVVSAGNIQERCIVNIRNWNGWLVGAGLLLGCTSLEAQTLQVDCGGGGSLSSINAALKALGSYGSDVAVTIDVKGACNENLAIRNLARLTIAGMPGASISDASNGTRDVIAVDNSRLTLTGMTVNGSVNTDGVDCYNGAYCYLVGNTIQGAYDGVGIYKTATGVVVGGVLQNNAATGLQVLGEATAVGATIQRNPTGVNVVQGGRAGVNVGDPVFYPVPTDTPVLVVSNGVGIFVGQGAEVKCTGCTIRNNTAQGILADVSAAVSVIPSYNYDGSVFQATITNNGSVGVYVGDLASATFTGNSSVSGNAQPNIDCNAATAVTRGAIAAAGGATYTNCSH